MHPASGQLRTLPPGQGAQSGALAYLVSLFPKPPVTSASQQVRKSASKVGEGAQGLSETFLLVG